MSSTKPAPPNPRFCKDVAVFDDIRSLSALHDVGSIIVWYWIDNELKRYQAYPQEVSEALTVRLLKAVAEKNRKPDDYFLRTIPCVDADVTSPMRALKVTMRLKEEHENRFRQVRVKDPTRSRKVFPCAVQWIRMHQEGPVLYPSTIQWDLETAYTQGKDEVIVWLDGAHYRVQLVGGQMFQFDAEDPTKKQRVRRQGPEMFQATLSQRVWVVVVVGGTLWKKQKWTLWNWTLWKKNGHCGICTSGHCGICKSGHCGILFHRKNKRTLWNLQKWTLWNCIPQKKKKDTVEFAKVDTVESCFQKKTCLLEN